MNKVVDAIGVEITGGSKVAYLSRGWNRDGEIRVGEVLDFYEVEESGDIIHLSIRSPQGVAIGRYNNTVYVVGK